MRLRFPHITSYVGLAETLMRLCALNNLPSDSTQSCPLGLPSSTPPSPRSTSSNTGTHDWPQSLVRVQSIARFWGAFPAHWEGRGCRKGLGCFARAGARASPGAAAFPDLLFPRARLGAAARRWLRGTGWRVRRPPGSPAPSKPTAPQPTPACTPGRVSLALAAPGPTCSSIHPKNQPTQGKKKKKSHSRLQSFYRF